MLYGLQQKLYIMVSTQHFENQAKIRRYPACYDDAQILRKYGKSTANCQSVI